MSKRRRRPPSQSQEVRIESMSHEGRGITRVNGKTVFVFGALAGETVSMRVQKSNRNFDQATTVEVIEASPQRISPACAAFQVCGGCSLQHLDSEAQLSLKQQALQEMMTHAGIEAGEMIPSLRGNSWGYRNKARLGVRYVAKKGRVLVGFRERNSSFIADMQRCEVLLPRLGHKIDLLAEMIARLDARAGIPQIEVAADSERLQLVFRHLQPLTPRDREILSEFGRQHDFYIQLQPAGPTSVHNLYPEVQALSYDPLGDGRLNIAFHALDFIQVNTPINQQMVAQALKFLDLQAADEVLDLFCGLGNFTLPMALQCGSVTGVEVDVAMLERARDSAVANGIENTQYHNVDLTRIDTDYPWMRRRYDKILLDPPRSGAQEIAAILGRFGAEVIVYVSCQPSSLVRDTAIICAQGYRLSHLGIMDMFPQTAHVESMAVFVANSEGKQ